MSSHREAVVTAALLTLLLVFPTASQDIQYGATGSSGETGQTDGSPIISTSSTPETEINLNSEDAPTVKIEKQDALYVMDETPHRSLEKLETPDAELKIKKTNDTEVTELSSPHGTFEKGLKNGKKFSDFEGLNKTYLISKMNEMEEKLEKYRTRARQKMLPDIKISISKEKASEPDERIVIDNEDTEPVELAGWTIENSDGDTYTFEELEMPARTTLEVYTKPEAELNVTESTERLYVYGTGADWDYYSEEAVLTNFEGQEVAEDSY